MHQSDLSDATLILFGHGTTLNSESGAAVLQHAEELRRRNIFADVREAFWKQTPRLQEMVAQIASPRVFFAPLFMSEGYFSEKIIPEALGFGVQQGKLTERTLRRGEQVWFYCQPVGTHPGMTRVVLDRARSVVAQPATGRALDDTDITLFIAGHGTGRDERSRKSVEAQVELLRQLGLYAGVHGIFLEEKPRIQQCFEIATSRGIVIVPFFVGDGLHVKEDIPVLLGEAEATVKSRIQGGEWPWSNPTERDGKRVWYSRSVGTDSILSEVILERVKEAASWAVAKPKH